MPESLGCIVDRCPFSGPATKPALSARDCKVVPAGFRTVGLTSLKDYVRLSP